MEKIKQFFVRYSYDAVKMFVDQMALSLFGLSLAVATVKNNKTLMLLTSIGAVIFYVFILYGVSWKMGDEDRKRIRRGEDGGQAYTGTLVSILAKSLNFIMAILIAIGIWANIENLYSIPKMITLLTQGMYQGILTYIPVGMEGETVLNLYTQWWIYFLLPIPAMLTSTIGYLMGKAGILLTKLTVPDLPASDRPTKQERREREKAEREKDK